MVDPTYRPEEIEANPVWQLAFTLSELQNDTAPIGWSKYIFLAKCLLNLYEMKRRESTTPQHNQI
jgi:hypothetical protein